MQFCLNVNLLVLSGILSKESINMPTVALSSCVIVHCSFPHQMQDQLLRTMEEENRNLLQQVNKLLEQNQQLLMKTLESKDQYLEEEKLFQ